MPQSSVRATLFRGGTTKGVYFVDADLPSSRKTREELLLRSFGSPDAKQVDGVGGSHSTASKAMIIDTPADPDIDLEYLFAQVGIEKPVVDWGGNCGNLTFAVGPFGLERGLVEPEPADERVALTLRNQNTGTIVEQEVPVAADGMPRYRGTYQDAGLPRPGASIRSWFQDPGGSVTGTIFPTGNRREVLRVDGLGEFEVSFVDVSNPCVFLRANEVGLTAQETPEDIDTDPSVLDRLERIRSEACEQLGLVEDSAEATSVSPGIPKIAVIGERASYETSTETEVAAEEYDLLARIMSMQKAHHAYSVTGAMCTAAAATYEGTVPASVFQEGDVSAGEREIAIGHPKGIMTITIRRDGPAITAVGMDRTARALMDGRLYYLPAEERT